LRIKSRRKEGVPIQLDHIYTGDCLEVLKTLPDESVHCCITSPPYYALRDYGVDGQIGREATPKEYISRLTEVFAEVRRVLRSDGTLWLNISDTYAGKGNQGGYVDAKNPKGRNGQAVALNYKVEGCKPKDMIGIPWMLAFSLRDSGWYLRNDIIWMKENPMPESVKDRCARCYEHIFLFSKSRKYFFDYKAISEPIAPGTVGRSLSLVIDALDSLVDIDGLVRKGNVLHLESAKLADPNAGKQCNQNTRRFSVQVHVDALNKGLFLIFGERVDFLDTQLFWVLNQVPIQQWNRTLTTALYIKSCCKKNF